MTADSKGYPFSLFVYDAEGKHGEPVDVPHQAALRILFEVAVAPAVSDGREVVITDCEDYAVFHAKDGKVIFPEPVPV